MGQIALKECFNKTQHVEQVFLNLPFPSTTTQFANNILIQNHLPLHQFTEVRVRNVAKQQQLLFPFSPQ